MRARAVLASLMFAACACCGFSDESVAQEREVRGEYATPDGTLRWTTNRKDGATMVYFDDASVASYRGEGFGIADQFRLDGNLVLLLRLEGGSACVTAYALATIDRQVTEPFGSCGQADIRQEGDSLLISTPGACSKSDSQPWLDTCAEELRSTYVYEHGKLRQLTQGHLETPRPDMLRGAEVEPSAKPR